MDFRVFNAGDDAVTLDLDDVVFIKYVNRRTYFHTTTQRYYVTSTLKEMAKLTADIGFVQIDKNIMINMRRVEELKYNDDLEEYQVFVNGIGYTISRRKLSRVRNSIHNFIQ